MTTKETTVPAEHSDQRGEPLDEKVNTGVLRAEHVRWGVSAVCEYCVQRTDPKRAKWPCETARLLDALDAAQARVATLTEQRDILLRDIAQLRQGAAVNGGLYRSAEDDLTALRARVEAVISGYDDIRDTCDAHTNGRQCLLCDIRDALTPPA